MTTIRSIRQPVATLSGGQRQSVAVARAVMWNSKLVILDEPTAALGVSQTEQVLALVNRLAEQGLGVILISHNLHDIFEAATRITVLRLGRDIGVYEREKTTQDEIVHAITAGVADEGLRDPGDRERGEGVSTDVAAVVAEPEKHSYWQRFLVNVRSGNLGSAPVLGALLIVVIAFGFTAQNFFTPVNFSNLIGQMVGHVHARLRRRVRAPDRRDRPVDRLRQRRRRA